MSFRKNIQVDVTSPNFVLAGDPVSGTKAPAYRALVAADIPALPLTKISGWTNANTALNSLLPSQTGKNGYVLGSNGTDSAWVLGTNQSITVSGDASGSGTTAITLTLATQGGLTPGTYAGLTVNAKGLVTNAVAQTTLVGYGITDAIPSSQKGANSGVATLDSGGKVPTSQLPASVTGGLNYQGTWNATTNTTPTLANGVGTKGYYYKVTVAGNTNIDGNTNWTIGDLIVFNGTTWDKIEGGTSDVVSVAGKVGVVTLVVADVSGAAPIDSPTFTTVANAPTPTGSDNSTKIATTAFVKGQGYLTANQSITVTGDATGSGTTSIALTLPVINSNVGTFNNVTVNAKGQVTAASNVAYLTANQAITLTGDVTGTGNGSFVTTLKNTGTAGTYKQVTTDAQGRVTSGQVGDISPVVTKTTSYTATTADSCIFVDATSGAVVITMPASPVAGQTYEIKRIDGVIANAVTINGNGKNIDEASTQGISTQYDCLTVVYNGTQWYLI